MKAHHRFAVLAAIALALGPAIGLTGCASTEPSGNPNLSLNELIATSDRHWEAAPEYIVEPPDVLVIAVQDNPDLRTEAPVRPDGRISVPLLGDVAVAGRTVTEIRAEMETRFAKYLKSVHVSVAVTEFMSKQIFVYGEVMAPGAVPYTGTDTVVSVIAKAGTLDWRASPNSIQVTRGDRNNPTILPVRLEDIVIADDDRTNYPLRPNDIVWVPPSTLVEVGDFARELFWPFQWLLAPAQVYETIFWTNQYRRN